MDGGVRGWRKVLISYFAQIAPFRSPFGKVTGNQPEVPLTLKCGECSGLCSQLWGPGANTGKLQIDCTEHFILSCYTDKSFTWAVSKKSPSCNVAVIVNRSLLLQLLWPIFLYPFCRSLSFFFTSSSSSFLQIKTIYCKSLRVPLYVLSSWNITILSLSFSTKKIDVMASLMSASSIGLLSDKTPLAKEGQRLINMLLFICLTLKSMDCRRRPSISSVRKDHCAGRAGDLISLSSHSFLRAFSQLLQQWHCLEVRDKDAVPSKDAQYAWKGDSLRVWDDIMVCISGPWEKSHSPSLGHVTCRTCIWVSGSPNLSQVRL